MAKSKKKIAKKSSKKSVKKSVKKTAKKSAKKSVKKSIKKAVKKAAKKSTVRAAKKQAKKAAKKQAKKAAKKTTVKTSSSTTAQEPIEKKKSANAPAAKTTGKAPLLAREGTVIGDRPVIVDGHMVLLNSLRGERGLVLYFYPKDATPGCTQEACDFRDASATLQAKGFSVVGVSPDSADSHRKFADKHALNFPLISDPDLKLCKEFGVWGEKQLYGRSFMGVIRSTFVMDRSLRIRKAFSPVSVSGHTKEVEMAIQTIRE